MTAAHQSPSMQRHRLIELVPLFVHPPVEKSGFVVTLQERLAVKPKRV